MNQIICVIEAITLLALLAVGMAILLDKLAPGEALKRVVAFLVVVLVAPELIAFLFQKVVSPALRFLWTASKPVFQVIGVSVVLLLFGWLVMEFVGRRSGGD